VAALTKALDAWWWPTAVGPWMRCFCADYRDLCFEHEKDYVTTSREKMLGMKLEEMQAGREQRLPQISAAIEPLRKALGEHAWLGGTSPNYADYRILGPILFLASVGKQPALAVDDPLRDWIERCRDLFGGLGRHPGLHELYGLTVPEGGPEPYMRESWRGGIYKRNTGPESTRAETEFITKKSAR
jgi:hypothetical protein